MNPHTEPIPCTPPNSTSRPHSPIINPAPHSYSSSQLPTGPLPADPPTSPRPPFDISPGLPSNAPSDPLISGPPLGSLSTPSPTNNSTLLTNSPPSSPSGPNYPGPSTTPVSTSPSPSIPSSSPPDLGRGMRTKVLSVLLHDFVTNSIVVQSSSCSTPSLQSASGTPYPIAHYVNCDNFSMQHRLFLAAITLGTEAKSFKEAMRSRDWRSSMADEIKALEANNTWSLVPLPPVNVLLVVNGFIV